MKTLNEFDRRPDRRCVHGLLPAALMALSLSGPFDRALAEGDADFAENALFSPSRSLLRAEQRGRVTIYDGLTERLVERALDTQFERIGHMMFIRTRQSLPDGAVEIDDDC